MRSLIVLFDRIVSNSNVISIPRVCFRKEIERKIFSLCVQNTQHCGESNDKLTFLDSLNVGAVLRHSYNLLETHFQRIKFLQITVIAVVFLALIKFVNIHRFGRNNQNGWGFNWEIVAFSWIFTRKKSNVNFPKQVQWLVIFTKMKNKATGKD